MADTEHDEIKNPKKSQEWLDLIEDSTAYFRDYLDSCDNIDKAYSSLEQYRNGTRDRDFALFWSNIQVMGPSIYARPPQPVVTPKFKDRRPVYRTASELLERVATVAFDKADINSVMLQCRDDLTICGRGVAWVRDGENNEVCIEHLDRRDFLHEPARKWADVCWVARRGWLTYEEMEERFGADVAAEVSYQTKDRNNSFGPQDHSKKCGVWEIWHKGENKVVWVTSGVEDVLEESAPHLKLEGFFPCPQPAYATLERRTLIPVADMIYYKGQLEQINLATARIHALSNALRMKGFYPGGGDVSEAIEAAMNAEDDGRVMIPVPSMAAFTNGDAGIVWLPIDQVAATLTALVEFRRQIIDDVYQIIGLSDIMRGATEASETATAQQIKQQNGSYRVRDKQNELVRLARDLVRIACEIIAEKYSRKDLEEMAQMDLPHKADIDKQLREVKGQIDAINAELNDPEVQAMAQANPEAAQGAIQQAQGQLEQLTSQAKKLEETVTMEAVLDFLRDEKLRPFVLDIETDSTIYPDEMQEKASRAEFLQVVMGTMPAVAQLAALGPQALALAGGVLKFALAPYRVGRELDGLVDDFVDSAPQIAQQMQQQGEGGEDMAALAEAEMEKAKAQMAKVEADTALKQAEMQLTQAKMQTEFQEKSAKLQLENDKLQLESAKAGNEAQLKLAEMEAKINHLQAQTAKLLSDIGLDVRKQDLEEYRTATDTAMRETEMVANEQHRSEDMAVAERDKGVEREFRAKEMEANQRGSE